MDYETLSRTPRRSAALYAEIARANLITAGMGDGLTYADGTPAVLKVAIPDGLDGHSPFGRELQALPAGTKFVVAFPSEKSDEAIANWRQLGFVRTIELPAP